MKSDKFTTSLRIAGLLTLVSMSGYVWAQQGPRFGPPMGEEEVAGPLPDSKVTIEERDGFRYITSNGIPNHPTGKFPNPNNPGAIKAQDYKFRVTLAPAFATQVTQLRHNLFGVALSGVPFDPTTAEFWNNNRAWNYEALSGKLNMGTDNSNAHVQPGGVYHYHGLPNDLVNKLAKKDQMTLLAYAADGFPIYSPYGYTVANDSKSKLKKLTSSYRLKEGTRPSGMQGPGGEYDGSFAADWEYVKDAGDLDDCNGRTGVTPEYPKGTYYYVLTNEFPFVPRGFKGTPDKSFIKGPPQQGMQPGGGGQQQGGPNGGPPNGGPPNGGPGGGPPPRFGPPPPRFTPPQW